MGALRVLCLEDSPADAELALAALEQAGLRCEMAVVQTRPEFEARFAAGNWALVLADYRLPGYTGLEALEHVRRSDPMLPFILVSGALGEERAVEALRAGATDFVLKGSLARLAPAVQRALEERRIRQLNEDATHALAFSERRLRLLSRHLIQLQEAERRHLARELHDDIGQGLTALKINLEALARGRDERELPARVAEAVETTRHALERIRALTLNLRPLQLDDLGLAAAVRSHLDREATLAGLAPAFEARDIPRSLPQELEIACFRVFQEALNNVAKHAQASAVWVRLFLSGDSLVLSVRDDGAGFDVAAAREQAGAGASLGMVSMEERVALAGGTLEIRSRPGHGSTVLAVFPGAGKG